MGESGGCNRYVIVIIIWPIWLDTSRVRVLSFKCEAVGVSRLGIGNDYKREKNFSWP